MREQNLAYYYTHGDDGDELPDASEFVEPEFNAFLARHRAAQVVFQNADTFHVPAVSEIKWGGL